MKAKIRENKKPEQGTRKKWVHQIDEVEISKKGKEKKKKRKI